MAEGLLKCKRGDFNSSSIEIVGTALHSAARLGEVYTVKCLINEREGKSKRKIVNFSNRIGESALLIGSNHGHHDVVETLLREGADVHCQDIRERTALHVAVENVHLDVVRSLIDNGADLNLRDSLGRSSFLIAVEMGLWLMYWYMVERVAVGVDIDLHDSQGCNSLMKAIENGLDDMAVDLLTRGASIDAINTEGDNVIIKAAEYGRTPVIVALIDRGADIDFQGRNGHTALIWAARNGHGEIVNILLSKHARVDIKTVDMECKDKWTALIWASYQGHSDIVRSLVHTGGVEVDIDYRERNNRTALIWAAERGHLDSVSVFVEAGADLNLWGLDNSTALLCALIREEHEIAKLLITKGARLDLPNSKVLLYHAQGRSKAILMEMLAPRLSLTDIAICAIVGIVYVLCLTYVIKL